MIREPWGGSEELWHAMAKAAIQEGHTIIHLSFDFPFIHPKLKELQAAGAYLYQRPGYFAQGLSARGKQLKMLLNFIKKKLNNPFRQVFRHHPDIILYNGTCYSIAGEGLLLRGLEKSAAAFYILGHLNAETAGGLPELQRRILLKAYQRAREVYFIAERSRQTAERQLCHAIPNAALVRNPVNMKNAGAIALPAGDKIRMATVGNLLTSHKGQDILLSVLRERKWVGRDWELNIYGEGADREYLEDLVVFYRLAGRVVLHGKTDDIRAVWEQNHLLVMPSHMEGMPLAIVEAMLCGRPCVATDVGGAAEWIVDGESGFIAAAATTDALDKALERAWLDKDRWVAIGLRAHERATAMYDPAAGRTLLEKITKL
jgi:glycosyltransferase involved in cell wall biosynthesis